MASIKSYFAVTNNQNLSGDNPSLVKIYLLVFQILSGYQSRAIHLLQICKKMTGYNPNPGLVNIHTCTKFGHYLVLRIVSGHGNCI